MKKRELFYTFFYIVFFLKTLYNKKKRKGEDMPRFSIIVPIYNVEKYLTSCLESIQKQTFSDFEVLMIDDGTKDGSKKIMKAFEKDKRFHSYHKENGGLSDARNYGIERAKGEYLLFVDSDDAIQKELLFHLDEEIQKHHPEVIKFQIMVLGKEQKEETVNSFSSLNGEEAFETLILNPYFVTAWSYAYQRKFFMKHHFQYQKGRYHEDFGLTPLIILKATSVSSIPYLGYQYFIRENSIMTDHKKTFKKAMDSLYFFDFLLEESKKLPLKEKTRNLFQSYLANTLLCKSKALSKEEKKFFLFELKKRKIDTLLLEDTILRKGKKFLIKLSLPLYVTFFVKGS